ncbi:MAG: hypothetical protein WKF43_03280 [Acidimicrobiales bacterium]
MPGSVRRTATIDLLRSHGWDGELVVTGRGHLETDPSGSTVVRAEAQLHAGSANGRLVELTTTPVLADAGQLVGALVGPGFRARVDATVPVVTVDSPLYLLFDDLPVTALCRATAMARHVDPLRRRQRRPHGRPLRRLAGGNHHDGRGTPPAGSPRPSGHRHRPSKATTMRRPGTRWASSHPAPCAAAVVST